MHRTAPLRLTLAFVALGLLASALAWATGTPPCIISTNCPTQFCDDLGSPRSCQKSIYTCTFTYCDPGVACMTNPTRKAEVLIVRNVYD